MAPADRPPVRLPDPLRSQAVLVGPRAYQQLTPLPAVARNLTRLQALLTDRQLWGLPGTHCAVLDAPSSTDEVLTVLMNAAAAATDTLLFYFAGHGLLDPDSGRLWLGLEKAGIGPIHDAIVFDEVRRHLRRSACLNKIAILDCCYSGRAMDGVMTGTAELADRLQIDGSYVLTACSEDEVAIVPPGATYTAFTGELLDVFDRGIPGAGELLDNETVYWRVRSGLEAAGRTTPQQRSRDVGGRIALVRNRAHPGRRAEPADAPRRRSPGRPPAAPARREPRLSPVELIEKITALRTAGRSEESNHLLDAAGAGRPAQETAYLLDRLPRHDADRVVASVAQRSPAEVARLITALDDLGQDDDVHRLRVAVGQQDADRATRIAEQLPPDGRDELLSTVAGGYIGQPEMIIRLVGALSSAGRPMYQALNGLLTRLTVALPAADAAALADALRSAGRQDAAFRLYRASLPAMLGRPQDDLVTLAAAMHAGGHPHQAFDLLEGAALTCKSADRADQFTRALRGADLPAQIADDAITLVATALPDGELTELAIRMIRRDQDKDADRLVKEAAARRGIDSTVTFVRALLDAGRPVDAQSLTLDNSARSPEDLLVLLRGLIGQDRPGLVTKLLDTIAGNGWGLGTIADMIISADGAAEDPAQPVEAFLRTRAPGDILAVALALIRADRRPAARRLLAVCAEALASAFDEDTCVSYTRLTATPPAAEPAQIRAPDARVWWRSAVPRVPQDGDLKAEPPPPRGIRIPDRPLPVPGRGVAFPGLDTDGLRERSALVVDLVAALPHKVRDLAWMTDGGTPGAPALLVGAVMIARGVNGKVMASIFAAGDDDYVVTVVEGITRSRQANAWWMAIQPVGDPGHYLRTVLGRCSLRAVAAFVDLLNRTDSPTGDQVLTEARHRLTQDRLIIVGDELVRREQPRLAARLLDAGDGVPLDAATQAGLAAVKREVWRDVAPTGTPVVATIRVGRAAITLDANGVRLRRGLMFFNGEPSISYQDLSAQRSVRWDGTGLVFKSAGFGQFRWITGRARPEFGLRAAEQLTAIANQVNKVLSIDRDKSG